MKSCLFIILFCSSVFADTEHIIGVPPNLDKYEISLGIESRSVQVSGTLAPPEAVINGKKVKLVELKKSDMAEGVYVGKNSIKTNGKLGRFYYELEPSSENTDLILVGKKSYKVNLSSKKTFIEQPIAKNIFLNKNEPAVWVLKGKLPSGVALVLNNKELKVNKQGLVEVPLTLKDGRHNLNIKIKSESGVRTTYIPYKITKTVGKNNKVFLSVDKLNGEHIKEAWDIPYYGLKLATRSNPNNKIAVNGDSYQSGVDGKTELKIKYDCSKKFPNYLNLNVSGVYGDEVYKKNIKSSDCEIFNKKQKSRFYFRMGLGHFGLVLPDYGEQRGMYSKHLGLGPMVALGIRLYKRIYFEARGGKTQSFRNKSRDGGDSLQALGGGSYWLGYPYRGKYFAAIGFLNYTASNYIVGDDPNFNGLSNTRATAIGLDGGYRWFISPSWTWTARLTFTTTYMSFQEKPSRVWPFYIIEPVGLEYYF